MAGKNIIASFLFFLLAVFFCNNLPCEVYTSFGNNDVAQQSINSARAGNSTSGSGISFNKPTLKRDHVKVRYTGGECNFQVYSTHEDTQLPEYLVKAVAVTNSCFIC